MMCDTNKRLVMPNETWRPVYYHIANGVVYIDALKDDYPLNFFDIAIEKTGIPLDMERRFRGEWDK